MKVHKFSLLNGEIKGLLRNLFATVLLCRENDKTFIFSQMIFLGKNNATKQRIKKIKQ